jgi:hypothetical protein
MFNFVVVKVLKSYFAVGVAWDSRASSELQGCNCTGVPDGMHYTGEHEFWLLLESAVSKQVLWKHKHGSGVRRSARN